MHYYPEVPIKIAITSPVRSLLYPIRRHVIMGCYTFYLKNWCSAVALGFVY
jgi:hypothetical protein